MLTIDPRMMATLSRSHRAIVYILQLTPRELRSYTLTELHQPRTRYTALLELYARMLEHTSYVSP